MAHAYRYGPLDPRTREIRLLSVQSIIDDVPRCSLQTVALDDEVEYLALSYVWGTDKVSRQILVDGQAFWIRANLHDYLSLVAKEQTDCHGIFVDAVCINQDDIDERSQQVALMGEVYKRAAEVVVWFGMEHDWTSWLVDHYPAIEDSAVLISCMLPGTEEDGHHLTDSDEQDVRLTVLTKLCEHVYWTRLWTVQEYIMPHQLTLRISTLRMSSAVFERAVRNQFWRHEGSMSKLGELSMHRASVGDEPSWPNTVRRFNYIAEKIRVTNLMAERRMPLYRTMNSFSKQDCSEVRDKVFGLLGLCGTTFTPDYTLPIMQIYTRVLVEGLVEMLAAGGIDVRANPLPLGNFWSALTASLGLSFGHTAVLLVTVLAMDEVGLDYASLISLLALTMRLRHPRLWRFIGQHWLEACLRLSAMEASLLVKRFERMRVQNSKIVGPDYEARVFCEWQADVKEAHQASLGHVGE